MQHHWERVKDAAYGLRGSQLEAITGAQGGAGSQSVAEAPWLAEIRAELAEIRTETLRQQAELGKRQLQRVALVVPFVDEFILSNRLRRVETELNSLSETWAIERVLALGGKRPSDWEQQLEATLQQTVAKLKEEIEDYDRKWVPLPWEKELPRDEVPSESESESECLPSESELSEPSESAHTHAERDQAVELAALAQGSDAPAQVFDIDEMDSGDEDSINDNVEAELEDFDDYEEELEEEPEEEEEEHEAPVENTNARLMSALEYELRNPQLNAHDGEPMDIDDESEAEESEAEELEVEELEAEELEAEGLEESEVDSEAEAESEAESELEAENLSEPESEKEPELEAENLLDLDSEKEPEPSERAEKEPQPVDLVELESEAESEPEPQAQQAESESELEELVEPIQETEPIVELSPEPERQPSEPVQEAEPIVELSPEPERQPSEPVQEAEPIAELSPEPEPEHTVPCTPKSRQDFGFDVTVDFSMPLDPQETTPVATTILEPLEQEQEQEQEQGHEHKHEAPLEERLPPASPSASFHALDVSFHIAPEFDTPAPQPKQRPPTLNLEDASFDSLNNVRSASKMFGQSPLFGGKLGKLSGSISVMHSTPAKKTNLGDLASTAKHVLGQSPLFGGRPVVPTLAGFKRGREYNAKYVDPKVDEGDSAAAPIEPASASESASESAPASASAPPPKRQKKPTPDSSVRRSSRLRKN